MSFMICERCHEREATVHITEICDPEMKKINLCEPCCQETQPGLLEHAKKSPNYPPPPNSQRPTNFKTPEG